MANDLSTLLGGDTAHIRLSDTPPSPPPAPPRSPFHLTPQQVEFFDENGYLVLKNWVQGELLSRLRAAADRWIEHGEAVRRKAKSGADLTPEEQALVADLAFAQREDGEVFFRVDYLHAKGEAASLELLGSPQVLAVAESLCGPNFVPTYESMVFKKAGDGEIIPWHQDAVHPRNYRVFNYDLYLDASKTGGGALRVVPKSQKAVHDACSVAERYGWDLPGVIHVEMEPGDVLLHDVMVLHGSERTLGKALRRTLYYEFRSAEMVETEGPWDADWVTRRLRMLPVALRRHAARFPALPQFNWNPDPRLRPEVSEDDEVELRIAHQWHTPGAYCSATSAPAEVVERAMAKLETK